MRHMAKIEACSPQACDDRQGCQIIANRADPVGLDSACFSFVLRLFSSPFIVPLPVLHHFALGSSPLFARLIPCRKTTLGQSPPLRKKHVTVSAQASYPCRYLKSGGSFHRRIHFLGHFLASHHIHEGVDSSHSHVISV